MSPDPRARPAPALATRPSGPRLPDDGILDALSSSDEGDGDETRAPLRLPARIAAGVLGLGFAAASLLLCLAGLGALTGGGSFVNELPMVVMSVPGVYLARMFLRAAGSKRWRGDAPGEVTIGASGQT